MMLTKHFSISNATALLIIHSAIYLTACSSSDDAQRTTIDDRFGVPVTDPSTIDPLLPSPDPEPPLADINLIVTSFAIDTEVTSGGIETVSAIIQNVGTSTLTDEGYPASDAELHVGYYLSTDDVITVDDIRIGDTSIFFGDSFTQADVAFGFESLSPGENYQYDHPLSVKGNVPTGTYYAGAIVDYIDYYHWYTFPRATDTVEYQFPVHGVVQETNEDDNARVLSAHQVAVTNEICIDDAFESDDDSSTATPISLGEIQTRNFCNDNADWLQFSAVQGSVYKISTGLIGSEIDTQLILYDTDGNSILLFHDNLHHTPFIALQTSLCSPLYTVDLECGWPPRPQSEIVWEAQVTGTYFVKVRATTCDEDWDFHCADSPDGVGLRTEYTVTLQ